MMGKDWGGRGSGRYQLHGVESEMRCIPVCICDVNVLQGRRREEREGGEAVQLNIIVNR